MLPYWIFFFLAAIPAAFASSNWRLRPNGTRSVVPDAMWLMVAAIVTLIIGFRWRVGGDWSNYFRYLDQSVHLTFAEILEKEDFAYWALNWISGQLGWGIQGVNAVSGIIFALGLTVFCKSLPRPWLALAVAMPYMVTVVAMGYTRQSVALGFAMIGYVALGRQRYLSFALWVVLGATFHRSAVLLIPLAALTVTTNRYLIWPLVGVTAVAAYQVLLSETAETLITNYIDAEMQSSGALLRLGMNAVPAALLLVFNRRFTLTHAEYRLWRLFALISIAMFAAFFFTSYSTALDRMALYFIPLQLLVFSHLPDAFGQFARRNGDIVFAILAYYSAVLFVWLNYATHSRKWIPYQIDFNVGISGLY